MSTITITLDGSPGRALAPMNILKSVLAALNQGDVSGAVDQFADAFTFHDYGLDLEFTEKRRLTAFFEKSRELFPDTTVELVAAFECGDHAIAEWKLTATQVQPIGSISYQLLPFGACGHLIVDAQLC